MYIQSKFENIDFYFCTPLGAVCTEGFLTPFVFHSNSLANWGSSRASIEAKFHKDFNFLGFVRYFSARIEKSSKRFKFELNDANFEWFFEDCSILAEK